MLRTSVLFFQEKQQVVDRALEFTDFIGPMGDGQSTAIRAVNPSARLWLYTIPRYVQGPWFFGQWSTWAEKYRIDPQTIFLKDEQGRRVRNNEVSRPDDWAMIDMRNWNYQYWFCHVFLRSRVQDLGCDGVSVDIPMLFSEPINPPQDWHETRDLYLHACEQFFSTLRSALDGRFLFPNFTTQGWVENDIRHKRVVEASGSCYLQAGGLDTNLKKLDPSVEYIIGNWPDNVSIETDSLG